MKRRAMTELAGTLAEGVYWLDVLLRWAKGEDIADKDPRDGLASFAAAAEKVAKLEREGQAFWGKAGVFSAENLALLAHIRDILRPGLASEEARGRRREIEDTARMLLAGLSPPSSL
jgi:hypothetical protein